MAFKIQQKNGMNESFQKASCNNVFLPLHTLIFSTLYDKRVSFQMNGGEKFKWKKNPRCCVFIAFCTKQKGRSRKKHKVQCTFYMNLYQSISFPLTQN